jgi:hypothetical protein
MARTSRYVVETAFKSSYNSSLDSAILGHRSMPQRIHDNISIASLENKLRNSQDDVVILDCRFPNKIKVIRNQDGIVPRVVPGPEPEWYDFALEDNLKG